MAEFCLKCHNKMNATHYKFGNTARLFKRLFPKPEPEEVIIEWMHEKDPDEPEAEEIETEYLDF